MPDATTPHRILLERTAQMFGVRVADIFAPTHKDDIIHARFAVCLVLAERGMHPKAIGEVICRDRVTVMNSIAQGFVLSVRSQRFAARIEAIRSGGDAPREVTVDDVLRYVAQTAYTSVAYLLGKDQDPERSPLIAAAVLIAREEDLTIGTIAKHLGRNRDNVKWLLRNHGSGDKAQAIFRAYQQHRDTPLCVAA